MKRTVVCLCGSTRFKREFIRANFRETMAGKVVLSVGLYSHADAEVYAPTEAEKVALDELHLDKIDLSDEVLVLNCLVSKCRACGAIFNGADRGITVTKCSCGSADVGTVAYVGDSTRREIAYARAAGKVVLFLNPEAP
jgi:hypothetical protein